ncbi:MAG: 23S rRNA (uracil(1939)-C(5))-methyltransferase RlmD, partial [Holdemanella sp.]|nr:23S rRNA (uracil(1939)-C(5))-methyltransferase RlmD [Holdemanella sp.]
MKKNEEYIVECIDDTRLGSGVVKIDNQVVFIPDLLIGEKARIRIVKVDKNYCFGKIMELIEPSIHRIHPECKYSRLCGGCQYQHIDYAYQCERKTRQLKDLFSRALKRDIDVLPILSVHDGLSYRNKAQFPVQIINGKVYMGFYRKHSNDIVPCDRCLIQSDEINEIYAYIQRVMTLKQAKGLRHIFIRVSAYTKEAQVVFIGTYNPSLIDLTKKLVSAFKNITSVVFNENTRKDNVILGEKYKILYGNAYIMEMCMGNKIQLHFKSFFQVNPEGME